MRVALYVLAVVMAMFALLIVLDYLAPGRGPREAAESPGIEFVANPVLGQELFLANCARCHGRELQGTDRGPPLLHPVYRPDHHSDLAFQLAVRNGVVQHHWRFGSMPPIEGVSPEQVQQIIAYVRQAQRAVGIR